MADTFGCEQGRGVWDIQWKELRVFLMSIWFLLVDMSTPYLGGYSGGVPPLPIPNREVKPACADGTAMQCGRVGSRLFSSESPVVTRLQGSFRCGCPALAALILTLKPHTGPSPKGEGTVAGLLIKR